MPIIKQFESQKSLITKLKKALFASSTCHETLLNNHFSYTCYQSENERATVAEIQSTGYVYFTYTNLITQIRRRFTVDEYNNIVSNRKARVSQIKINRKPYTVQMKDFFDMHVDLFRDDEDLDFEAYCEIALSTKSTVVNIKDNTNLYFPQVLWHSGPETIAITKVYTGFDISWMVGHKEGGYKMFTCV